MLKKAEVPVTILVLGVLLVCIIAVVSVSLPFGKKYGGLEEVVELEKCLSYIEQYDFYLNKGYGQPQIKELPTFKNIIEGNFLICNSEGIKIKSRLP